MANGVQHSDGAVPILDIGAVDDEPDQEAERVGQDVPLAALDLLAGVEAADAAAFGGLDALAVDYAGARAGLRPSSSRAAVTRWWLIVFRSPRSRQS